MQTSYFGNIKKLPKGKAVSIARGNPVWFHGRVYLPLAPTWKMIKQMSESDYLKHYHAMLAKLDPKKVFEELGEDAILLCWEKPGEWCHRRIVAEWLERELGVHIPEYGQSEMPLDEHLESAYEERTEIDG